MNLNDARNYACPRCRDTGFDRPGTGYDSVCDDCAGQSVVFTSRSTPEPEAIAAAIDVACTSPCAKSKRGAVLITMGSNRYPIACNGPAIGSCDGSENCRRDCSKICVHAEERLLIQGAHVRGSEILHVKVIDSELVPSGPPSCWQCSKSIFASGISAVWLFHANGWRRYGARIFHALTLEHGALYLNLRKDDTP